MAKGFEFELSDGSVFQLVPNAGVSECAVSHGDTKIDVDVTSSSFKTVAPSGKSIAAIPSVVRFESKDITVGTRVTPGKGDDQPHIMWTCVECGNRWCCVKNGCANFGSGWICD
jgi:hypothetical protein